MWLTFSVREDELTGLTMGKIIEFYAPALGKDNTYQAQITNIQARASYATWRATKTNGQFDVKTFEIKARPTMQVPNLRPGMTVILK